ncbi:DUF2162 family putative transporter [Desulfolithobacter sp.]
MEIKSLVLGLAFSLGIFAVKSGAGLSFLFARKATLSGRLAVLCGFIAGYGIVFFLAWFLASRTDLLSHLDTIMLLLKNGMTLHFLLAALLLAWGTALLGGKQGGREITLNNIPQRVVSPVPSVTKILLRIDAADAVVGITHHSLLPPESADKVILGGFASPDPERLAALNPDVIFYVDLQKEVVSHFRNQAILINLSAHSINESFDLIRLIGRIFQRQEKTTAIIEEEERLLALIARKVTTIPAEKRQRVIRPMELNTVMAISDDYEKGLVDDLSNVDLWCQAVAHHLADKEVPIDTGRLQDLPLVLAKGIGALLAGPSVKIDQH